MISATDMQLLNCAEAIRTEDEFAHKVGETLAGLLQLKHAVEHDRTTESNDRWRTAWGTKTSCGLARSILHVFQEARK